MELKIVDAPFGIVLVIDDHRRAGASSETRTTQSGSQRRAGRVPLLIYNKPHRLACALVDNQGQDDETHGSGSGYTRPLDHAGHRHPKTPRLGDRAAHSALVQRRPAGQSGVALPGSPAARTTRV